MECNLTQPTENQQCFGALGEPFIFHLPTKTSMKTRLLKDNQNFLMFNNDTLTKFMVDKTTKDDSGDYLFEIYSSDGILLQKINIHLEILGNSFF